MPQTSTQTVQHTGLVQQTKTSRFWDSAPKTEQNTTIFSHSKSISFTISDEGVKKQWLCFVLYRRERYLNISGLCRSTIGWGATLASLWGPELIAERKRVRAQTQWASSAAVRVRDSHTTVVSDRRAWRTRCGLRSVVASSRQSFRLHVRATPTDTSTTNVQDKWPLGICPTDICLTENCHRAHRPLDLTLTLT